MSVNAGACPPPGISNLSRAAGGLRGLLRGGGGCVSRRSCASGERTGERGVGSSSGSPGSGVGLPELQQLEEEDGGVIGQALPGRVRQERARLLQEMQREHPQGLAPDGHHGAGTGGEAALCEAGASARPGRVGGGLVGSCRPGRPFRARAGPAGAAASSRPVYGPPGGPFWKVLLILQQKPGKYGQELVVPFTL